MKNFKIGDELELLHIRKCRNEKIDNWAKKAGLKKGEIYKVIDVAIDGSVRLDGKAFWQDKSRFQLANPSTVEIYTSRGAFKFRVIGTNGKVLNHLFNSKQGCKKGIEAFAKAMSNYKIVDLTK